MQHSRYVFGEWIILEHDVKILSLDIVGGTECDKLNKFMSHSLHLRYVKVNRRSCSKAEQLLDVPQLIKVVLLLQKV